MLVERRCHCGQSLPSCGYSDEAHPLSLNVTGQDLVDVKTDVKLEGRRDKPGDDLNFDSSRITFLGSLPFHFTSGESQPR